MGNELPPGCREEALVSAIDQSGYPLQGRVAYKLKDHFRITEEWGYFDSSTNEHRSLDIYGYRRLIENTKAAVQPSCAVLVECKRSRHPYVFFRLVTEMLLSDFPVVAGVRNRITISEPRKTSTEVPASRVLGLDKDPFVYSDAQICSSFCRAVPKGKEFELSGADPFRSIILPLARAVDHILAMRAPDQGMPILYPTLVLSVSVLDAPVILVESPDKTTDPVLTPWIRVVRHEAPKTTAKKIETPLVYTVDIIHEQFLDTFIQQHLLPFCARFAEHAVECGDILSRGGFVQNLNEWIWDQVRAKPG